MEVSLVLGCYHYPRLAELQIKMIRAHNGNVPILIVADGDSLESQPVETRQRYLEIAEKYNVECYVNPWRWGHYRGDLNVFYQGLTWCKTRFLCKLSQRYCIDIPGWLHTSVNRLDASNCSYLGNQGYQRFSEDEYRFFSVRTECVLMCRSYFKAEQYEPKLLPDGMPVETYFNNHAKLGSRLTWELVTDNRELRIENVYTKQTHTPEEYRALANKHGVTLDHDFDCKGWWEKPDFR